MKKLSEFLAEFIIYDGDVISVDDGSDLKCISDLVSDLKSLHSWTIKEIHKGLIAYQQHLKDDCPKTVGWTMIEKNLVQAIDRMEAGGNAPIEENVQAEKQSCENCDLFQKDSEGNKACTLFPYKIYNTLYKGNTCDHYTARDH